jgi:hypothetical protein
MEMKPKKSKRTVVLVLLAVIVAAGVGVGAYYYRDKVAKDAEVKTNARIVELETQVSDLKKQLALKDTTASSGTSSTTCVPTQPSASAVENIKASITSGNTAALEGYMASSVNVIFAASDGVGARTPTQAVSDVTGFIASSGTWNFNISASVLSSYGKGDYAQYFPATAVVGKSSANKVISFNFDCNGKISTVFMSADEALL